MFKFVKKIFVFFMSLLCFFLLKEWGFCENSTVNNGTVDNSTVVIEETSKQLDKVSTVQKDKMLKSEGKKCVKKKGEDERKERKDESWKEIIFPFTDEELKYIREKAERQKYITEGEYEKLGRVRYVYADDRSVFKINVIIDRATVVCFWKEIDESGYLIGSADFKSELIDNKKCVAIYPLKPFKESNLVVFVDGFPYSFTLREVYEKSEVDYVVIVDKKPYLEAKEFLLYLLSGNFPENVSRWIRVEKRGEEIKEFVFDGFNTLKAIECKRELEPSEKTWIVKGCVKDKCYFVFENTKN